VDALPLSYRVLANKGLIGLKYILWHFNIVAAIYLDCAG